MSNVLSSPDSIMRLHGIPIEAASRNRWRKNCADFLPNRKIPTAGRSNSEIAQELVVSVNTVKTQVQSIYRKLNVKSRWEACNAARQLKLL